MSRLAIASVSIRFSSRQTVSRKKRPARRPVAAYRDVVEGKLRADDAVLRAQRLRRDLAHQRLLPDRGRQGRLLQEAALSQSMSPNLSLYLALALYACGTLIALASLFARRL